jgi:hypothetical protein
MINREHYKPIVYMTTVNVMEQQLIPVNDTLSSLPIELSYASSSIDRWKWFKELEATFQMHKNLGSSETELEQIKVCILI